jgi:hypothetical protein
MSFNFHHLYELFEIIDGLQAKSTDKLSVAVNTWFDEYGPVIPRYGSGAVAFLSYLFLQRQLILFPPRTSKVTAQRCETNQT